MIKYLVMDVDGTLTDGKIYMSSTGEAMKAFNVRDGYGIHDILPPLHITPIIITGRSSDIVANRCIELNIKEVYQGVNNKLEKLQKVVDDLSKVAYIGDDMNDLSCIKNVKCAGGKIGCPADAAECVKMISDYISPYKGGEGAVRDFIEWIIKYKTCSYKAL